METILAIVTTLFTSLTIVAFAFALISLVGILITKRKSAAQRICKRGFICFLVATIALLVLESVVMQGI